MTDLPEFGVAAKSGKRTYVVPTLHRYGALTELTATGSGSQSESDNGSMSGMNCNLMYKAHNNCA